MDRLISWMRIDLCIVIGASPVYVVDHLVDSQCDMWSANGGGEMVIKTHREELPAAIGLAILVLEGGAVAATCGLAIWDRELINLISADKETIQKPIEIG